MQTELSSLCLRLNEKLIFKRLGENYEYMA